VGGRGRIARARGMRFAGWAVGMSERAGVESVASLLTWGACSGVEVVGGNLSTPMRQLDDFI
jgi:hypothetical protein